MEKEVVKEVPVETIREASTTSVPFYGIDCVCVCVAGVKEGEVGQFCV